MDYGNRRVNDLAGNLGIPNGRMISYSKGGYSARYHDHLVVFNATLSDRFGQPLWWGDLDLTVDESALLALAKGLDETLCVFYEGDAIAADLGRGGLDPSDALARFMPDGHVVPGLGHGSSLSFERDASGRMVMRSGTHGRNRAAS